jgi:hypothetical protein
MNIALTSGYGAVMALLLMVLLLLGKLGAGPDVRHLFAHQKPESCARCRFAKHHKRWGAKLPLVPGSPSLGTWLASRVKEDDDKAWGVGCIACGALDEGSDDAGQRSGFSAYEVVSLRTLQLQHFKKHAACKRHQQSVKQFVARLGVDAATSETSDTANSSAPSEAEFEEVLKQRLLGVPTAKGVQEVGQKDKIRKMCFCLSEAARMLDRAWLSNCRCIALHQDEKKPRLLLRFTASADSLETRDGFLAIARDIGTGSRNVRDATEKALRRFCTLGLGAPPRCKDKSFSGVFDASLFDQLRGKVELYNADAAADEQLAGEYCRTVPLKNDLQPLFPNLRLVVKDKAHASRRPGPKPQAQNHFN